MVARNAAGWYTEAERLVIAFKTSGTSAISHFPFANKILVLGEKLGIDLSVIGVKLADGASGYFFDVATNTALNLGEFVFTLAVALFILFFIYRDGERNINAVISKFASNQEKAHRYFAEIRATTTAVTVGTVFTCLVQGATAGLGYYVAGVQAPVLYGALTAMAAIVPVVGTGIVWVPLVAVLFISGAYLKALLLTIWCVFFVVLADNAIRPFAIGAKSNIPVPAIVLGAICGVLTLGILGLILGPVIFAILITVWRDALKNDNDLSRMPMVE
jgi:predicted PurR-regulated permease PerM